MAKKAMQYREARRNMPLRCAIAASAVAVHELYPSFWLVPHLFS